MPDAHENEPTGALADLWGLAAQGLSLQVESGVAAGRCERWPDLARREERFWALVDGALDEDAETAEWEHLRGCPTCLAAAKRILDGVAAASAQMRWSRAQIEALLARSAVPAPSPTEQALTAVRDLVLRLAERGLRLIEGTGELVPVTARVRGPIGRDMSDGPADERVLSVRWNRPWGRLAVDAEQTGPEQCDLTFTITPTTKLASPEALRLDWCTADGRPLESQHFEAGRVHLSDVGRGQYLVVMVSGEQEIDRLTFDLEGSPARRIGGGEGPRNHQ